MDGVHKTKINKRQTDAAVLDDKPEPESYIKYQGGGLLSNMLEKKK